MKKFGWLLAAPVLALICLSHPVKAAAPQIDAVEPLHWWVGMAESRLQLLVYGPEISKATVRVHGQGLTLERIERTDSPHHVFLHLRVASDATPGVRQLEFEQGNSRRRVDYLLKAREPGSAQRRGFTGQDVLLNLMPDRFANGDPSNDTIEGMGDAANRS